MSKEERVASKQTNFVVRKAFEMSHDCGPWRGMNTVDHRPSSVVVRCQCGHHVEISKQTMQRVRAMDGKCCEHEGLTEDLEDARDERDRMQDERDELEARVGELSKQISEFESEMFYSPESAVAKAPAVTRHVIHCDSGWDD